MIEIDHRPTRDEEGQADQEGGCHTLRVVKDGRHEVRSLLTNARWNGGDDSGARYAMNALEPVSLVFGPDRKSRRGALSKSFKGLSAHDHPLATGVDGCATFIGVRVRSERFGNKLRTFPIHNTKNTVMTTRNTFRRVTLAIYALST